MRKFKLLTTLFTSFLCMSSLAGCTTPPTQADIDEAIASIIPSPESIQREGINIQSIVFENVPEEIPVGSFDSFNIKLKITYSDGFVEHYPLKMKNFPNKLKEELLLVGSHNVTIAFRGSIVTYTFNIVQGVDSFLVRYLSYDGSVLKSYKVYTENPHVPENAPTGPERENDELFNYSFFKWDTAVTTEDVIIEDIDIYPLYNKVQKRYDVSKAIVPTLENGNIKVLHSNYGGTYYGLYETYLYLGRIDRVPLLYSDVENKDFCTHIHDFICYDMSDTSKSHDQHVTDYTIAVANNILSKGFDVDTTGASDYFTTMYTDPTNPGINVATGFEIGSALQGDTLFLFEDDVSYSHVYEDNLAEFVLGHDDNNATECEVFAAEDILASNQYFRASIETSIDVVARAQYYYHDPATLNNATDPNIEFMYFEYYFMLNLSNTFPVAEYCNDTNFNSTGTKIAYSMSDIINIITYVAEANPNA